MPGKGEAMENAGLRVGQCPTAGACGSLKQIFRVDYSVSIRLIFAFHSLSSVSLIRSTASPTSSSLVPKPRLKRIEDSASSLFRPIALSTCEDSGMPEAQAEPVEAARRGRRALRISCARKTSETNVGVPGMAGVSRWTVNRDRPRQTFQLFNKRIRAATELYALFLGITSSEQLGCRAHADPERYRHSTRA